MAVVEEPFLSNQMVVSIDVYMFLALRTPFIGLTNDVNGVLI